MDESYLCVCVCVSFLFFPEPSLIYRSVPHSTSNYVCEADKIERLKNRKELTKKNFKKGGKKNLTGEVADRARVSRADKNDNNEEEEEEK